MVAVSTTFAAITYFNYIVWTPLTDGVFQDDWTGNAGTIEFRNTSFIDGSTLRWDFWIQAVGTGTFASDARIVPPTLGNPTRTCWTVEGTAESPNAGTIRLSGVDTDLRFNPVSRKLEWYGYNSWLGRVSFWDNAACSDGIISDAEISDWSAAIATTSAGFVGRVKILGNAGGNTVFDSFYGQGVKFNASLFNTTLQRIRKNVGLLTRNISDAQRSWTPVGDKKFYINQVGNVNASVLDANTRSLIVVWRDLVIDSDITNTTNIPKWIIVLKNENGVWGNVYMWDTVKDIRAAIFAEGTIYSGESVSTLYNDTASEIVSLPTRQLYIYGAMISRNTIWGASQSATEVLCPYNESCTFADATKYDLNYFRGFQASGVTDPNRAYKDTTLDDYSLIIETDTRLSSNPPPGLE
jgi:hypothetical protein